jgi:hypothetical protein
LRKQGEQKQATTRSFVTIDAWPEQHRRQRGPRSSERTACLSLRFGAVSLRRPSKKLAAGVNLFVVRPPQTSRAPRRRGRPSMAATAPASL